MVRKMTGRKITLFDSEEKVMNTKKITQGGLLMLFVFMFSLNVFAEVEPFRVVEIESSKVVLSQDGTGIVKDIECSGCDFNIVKITAASKASNQGVEVDIVEVKNLRNNVVMVSFDPNTRVVQYIRW
jgi:hypothetical protein